MSKFNPVTTGAMRTVNNEGYPAYRMDGKTKLVHQVLTSFINESKFYGDNTDELIDALKSGIKKEPAFISKLAMFARREFNMRSVSHVLVGYLANIPEGKPFVRETVKGVVLRGDDATEILSFYLNTFGKPIPNSLRKALRDVFTGFDAYTLAKYKGESKSIKMRDILCLCHPTPKDDKQSETWKALLEDRIQPAYTWETELSAKGNNKETWEGLISSGKVGYMALLRNLRNIINAEPSNISDVFKKLSDPNEVRKSRQLPFRFLSAYRNIPAVSWYSRDALNAIDAAAEAAVENLSKIPGKTIIAIDVSGSMSSYISSKSDIRCCDISTMLGLIADKICEKSRVFTFDNYLKEIYPPKQGGLITNVVRHSTCGGGTCMQLPFDYILKNDIDCDRVIVISDNECNGWSGISSCQSLISRYRNKVNHPVWVHAIDLIGYGTQQFMGKETNLIAGWSEKVFEFIKYAEEGEDSLIKRIEEYVPFKPQ